jgi:hypothetical protein
MMQKKKQNPVQEALSVASMHTQAHDKANGKSRDLTPFEKGQRVRETFIKATAIATDKSGQVATRITTEMVETTDRLQQEKEKEELKKYGGRPDLIQHILEGVGNLDETPPVSRRFLLFGGPKKLAAGAGKELAPMLLPWPLNRVASLFKFFT